MHNTNARQWLSLADVAELTGIPVVTLRRYVSNGELPAYRVNKRLIRIKAADVDAMIRPIPTAAA